MLTKKRERGKKRKLCVIQLRIWRTHNKETVNGKENYVIAYTRVHDRERNQTCTTNTNKHAASTEQVCMHPRLLKPS